MFEATEFILFIYLITGLTNGLDWVKERWQLMALILGIVCVAELVIAIGKRIGGDRDG